MAVLNYFSFNKKDSKTEAQAAPVRALPASWYTTPAMYDIERRAIFSNRWLLMTFISRLQKTGDWLRYEFAGFDIIIVRGEDGHISAYHNTFTQSSEASEGSNFDLSTLQNQFRVHSKIDRNGFIWINLDAKATPEHPWEEQFDNVDVQARYADINFDDYDLDHTYQINADYNWKIASDNFNECYHCPTTHADIPAFLNLDSFDSDLKGGHIQHHCAPTDEQVKKGLWVHSTYYFPMVSTTVGKNFMMVQKFLPTSPTTCIAHYEIYKNRTVTDEAFHLIADSYQRVMYEDKALCNHAQANLNRGVFQNGLMHPRWEKAPLFFQQSCREAVTDHFEREKREGRQIWPAQLETKTATPLVLDEPSKVGPGLEARAEVLAY